MKKTTENPKILVAYISQTGNTKKVAEAIYDVCPQPKEIKPVKKVTSLEGYDLSFLGFPVIGEAPNKKTKAFLQTHVKNKTIALFITHMAPEEAPELPIWRQKFIDAAIGANIVGFFDCQGKASRLVKTFMRLSPNSKIRAAARSGNSQGQPDATRLRRAQIFAKEVVEQVNVSEGTGNERTLLLSGIEV